MDILDTKYFLDENDNLQTFEIFRESDPFSPRDEDINLTKLYIEWGRHKDHYGDDFKSIEAEIETLADKYLEVDSEEYEDLSTMDLLKQLDANAYDKVRVFLVYGYEHGGFTISLGNGYPYNDRWDSGIAGICVVTKDICEEYGSDFKDAEAIALAEVSTFDMYLQGDVYGCKVNDEIIYGDHYSREYGDRLFSEIANEVGYAEYDFYDTEEECLESVCKELD